MASTDPHLMPIPRAHQRSVPWKNGRGNTREVAIEPNDASVATGFRWRVSSAGVADDGPFSTFPGVDRTLWLCRGAGLDLSIDSRIVRLDVPFARVDFAGEAAVEGRLLGGPIDDLNVMVRRADTIARSDVHALRGGAAALDVSAGTTIALALTAEVAVAGHRLGVGDAVRAEAGRHWRLEVKATGGPAMLLVATFRPR